MTLKLLDLEQQYSLILLKIETPKILEYFQMFARKDVTLRCHLRHYEQTNAGSWKNLPLYILHYFFCSHNQRAHKKIHQCFRRDYLTKQNIFNTAKDFDRGLCLRFGFLYPSSKRTAITFRLPNPQLHRNLCAYFHSPR